MRTTYLATAFVADDHKYPNIKGTAESRHDAYWRCMLVMFGSSRRFNPTFRNRIYSNARPTNPKLAEALNLLGVEICDLEFRHRPPEGYCREFAGSLCAIDAFEHCARTLAHDEQVLFLDQDCVWIGSGNRIADAISTDGSVRYEIGYAPDHSVNGLTRRQARTLFSEFSGLPMSDDLPAFFGGEFMGFTPEAMRRILPYIEEAWRQSLDRFRLGLPKANLEEHIFSYAFWRDGRGWGNSGNFIARLWTAAEYRNTRETDRHLTIWHAPAEKGRGFRYLSNAVLDSTSAFWQSDPEEFRLFVGRALSIQGSTIARAARDGCVRVAKKFGRAITPRAA